MRGDCLSLEGKYITTKLCFLLPSRRHSTLSSVGGCAFHKLLAIQEMCGHACKMGVTMHVLAYKDCREMCMRNAASAPANFKACLLNALVSAPKCWPSWREVLVCVAKPVVWATLL